MIIDFHAHILPGLDHGCDDVLTCYKQLENAARYNVDYIVSTSHYTPYLETISSFLKRRDLSIKELYTIYEDWMPKIMPAAEVLIYSNIDKDKDLLNLCAVNTNTLLIEMPVGIWSDEIVNTLRSITLLSDVKVVLAHVDRYLVSEMKKIEYLELKYQINASALCSIKTRRRAVELLRNDKTIALGSDIHGIKSGYSQFHKSLKYANKYKPKLMASASKILEINLNEVNT